MARVPSLRPAIAKLAPRIASMRETRDTAQSYNINEVRRWYKSARWARLRQEVLERDLYTCRRTGVMLAGKAPEPDSPVVHHVVPHKGDERLFWDIDNLEAVSKEWHDSEAQREERRAS
ncbi:MAG: HNH endonuclease [Devosia sp.]|nr:HNH endonuclease [Devosia sp.]